MCAKSTRGSSRRCGANYNFEDLPDDLIRAYASLRNIPLAEPYSRSEAISAISAWKKTEGKK